VQVRVVGSLSFRRDRRLVDFWPWVALSLVSPIKVPTLPSPGLPPKRLKAFYESFLSFLVLQVLGIRQYLSEIVVWTSPPRSFFFFDSPLPYVLKDLLPSWVREFLPPQLSIT